ncbi:MAG: sigma-70 family RNA polymerase sigma factor [Actinomycetota bacterium]|nr:sigma-70 family RNA polymerase sigma factor [Actinomycetota bacterium]
MARTNTLVASEPGRAGVLAGWGDVASTEADLLRSLHDDHAGALSSYVVGLTNGDRVRAQDVVQETMLRAWRNPQVLDQSRGSARGWLFTVAKRIVIDEWRSARSHPEQLTDQVPERAVSGGFDDAIDRHVVMAALRTLSMEHREVVLECFFRGSSVAEAAEHLGIPPGTVKSRTHYAVRALRLAIDELGDLR